MGLFSKSSKQRRNSEEKSDNMQYWTPRGAIPAKMVNQQVQQVGDMRRPHEFTGYPHKYNNQEEGGRLFDGYEHKYAEREFREVPVATRMDFDRPSAGFKKVQRRDNVPPGDRARVVRSEINDPGPFRAVVPVDQAGRSYGVSGVIYHPESNPRGFERAPVMPLDRNGRRMLYQYQDEAAHGHRVDTWPPRDEDADELTMYESRYKQVRKSKSKYKAGSK